MCRQIRRRTYWGTQCRKITEMYYVTDIDLLNKSREHLETAVDIFWNEVPHKGHKLPYSAKKARLSVIPIVYAQQKGMCDNGSHTCDDRIVSLQQPHVRPVSIAENYKRKFGCYPAAILADKIYQTRKNRSYGSCAQYHSHDWLGHGIYFWEQNYLRAFEWAKSSKKIKKPAVIGAVIDLGYCLNLTDSASSEKLRRGYEILKYRCEVMGLELPKNKGSSKSGDILLRNLDCAVIEQLHDYNSEMNERAYDSVRGIFTEGEPVYEGACFLEKTHVQLCIVNPNCIKGYFNPLTPDSDYQIP